MISLIGKYLPTRTAPSVSIIVASRQAIRRVSTFDPTDVPNAEVQSVSKRIASAKELCLPFATSFAPIPKPNTNAKKNPANTVHKYWA